MSEQKIKTVQLASNENLAADDMDAVRKLGDAFKSL